MQRIFFYFLVFLWATACRPGGKSTEEEAPPPEIRTPVTLTAPETVPLSEYTELNATSSFLQSNVIKASASGYITAIHIRMGEVVHSSQPAFTLQTKEAHALGNTINRLDPSFHFTGLIPIRSRVNGQVKELNHQVGDFVQEGEQLAVVTDTKSFGFVLNLPYELRSVVSPGKKLPLELPDGSRLTGTVALILPDVDSVAQTQRMLIRVPSSSSLPQNLIARVRIVKREKTGAVSLPRAAVLSDESQSNFWVMKMIDSVRAVKVPVIRGMETSDRVEILRPVFTANDKILLTGNYGLPDTAKVKIMKSEE